MNLFRNMKIGLKLKLAFGLLSLFIVVVGCAGIYNVKKINNNTEYMYKYSLAGVKDMSQVKSNIIYINLKMLQIINERDKIAILKLQKEIDALKNQDDELLRDYVKTIKTNADREQFNEFNVLLQEYREKRIEVLKYINNENYTQATSYYPKIDAVNNKIIEYLDKYVEYNVDLAKEDYNESISLYKTIFYLTIILIGFVALFGGIISFKISSHISKNINNQELETSKEITVLEEKLREKYNELAISEANAKTDVIDIRRYQQQVEHIAYHDHLTDLPNRQYMYYRFNNDFMCKNNEAIEGAILFIDLDNFKYINDTMGHVTGDNLIIAVAQRLKTKVNEENFLVRIGGDEFIFAMNNIIDKMEVELFSREILSCLGKPFSLKATNLLCIIS